MVYRGKINGSEVQVGNSAFLSAGSSGELIRTDMVTDNSYYRLECISSNSENRIYTNPIWVDVLNSPSGGGGSGGRGGGSGTNALTIISPQNEKAYDSKRIFFNIQTNDELDEITYINYEDNRPREKTLCRNCENYERTLSSLEGFNNITFKAIENGVVVSQKNIWFSIDSRKPQISKTEPKKGFANGNFKAEIKEDSLESVKLHYGTDMKEINIEEECSELSGKIVCETEVDLSEYDGQEIEYSFSVEDIAGSIDESRPIKVKVDITSPVVNSFDYILDGRNVNFVFQVTEINFDEINYIDWKDSRPREIRLCSRLRNGICEARKTFKTGQHNLTINILDKAGNFIQEYAGFTV